MESSVNMPDQRPLRMATYKALYIEDNNIKKVYQPYCRSNVSELKPGGERGDTEKKR